MADRVLRPARRARGLPGVADPAVAAGRPAAPAHLAAGHRSGGRGHLGAAHAQRQRRLPAARRDPLVGGRGALPRPAARRVRADLRHQGRAAGRSAR
ncbi:hypothetical protein ACFSTC_53475 [Nonomuraea ferruginea]